MARSSHNLLASTLVLLAGMPALAFQPVTETPAPATPTAPTAPAAQPAASPEDLESAQRVIDRALTAYEKLRTYSDRGAMRFELQGTAGGQPLEQDIKDEMNFATQRPGKFSLTTEQVSLFNDGATLTVHAKGFGKFQQKPSPTDGAGLDQAGPFADAVGMHPVAQLMLKKITTATKLPLLESVTGIEKLELDGKAGMLVMGRGKVPGMPIEASVPVTYWFDDQTGLIGRLNIDMIEAFTKMFAEMGQGDGAKFEKAQITLTLSEVKPDAELAADAFAFKPGEDDVKVDDIQRAMMDDSGQETGPDTTVLVGQAAPEFSAKTLDGGTLSLKDLRGKVVLMDFWATWCGPCVRAIPHIQAIHEKYAEKGVVVVGMNTDDADALDAVKEFVSVQKVTFKQVLDGDGAIRTNYLVQGIPCTLLIDKDGMVHAVHVGFMPGGEKELTDQVERLIKGETLFDEETAAENKTKLEEARSAAKAEAEKEAKAAKEEAEAEEAEGAVPPEEAEEPAPKR